MKKEIIPFNHLNNNFYTMPKIARQVMTTLQFKETLLQTENFIMSCGHGWKLKSESLGAGMVEVRLIPFE